VSSFARLARQTGLLPGSIPEGNSEIRDLLEPRVTTNILLLLGLESRLHRPRNWKSILTSQPVDRPPNLLRFILTMDNVLVLDADSPVDVYLWDTASHNFGDTSHPTQAPKDLDLHAKSLLKWNDPAPGLNACNQEPVGSNLSILTLAKASSTIQTPDAVTSRLLHNHENVAENPDDPKVFACPFRKHNPKKYTITNSEWRSCALSGFQSLARVK